MGSLRAGERSSSICFDLGWCAGFVAVVTSYRVLALPFSVAVTAACLALFPLVERPFMHGRWPALVAQAVRTRSIGALGPLFAKAEPVTSSRRSGNARSRSGG